MISISHTAKEKYLRCPLSYYMHYNLNIREKVLGSPLFFGTLVEDGCNVLLKGGTLEQAIETFQKGMVRYKINGAWVDLATSPTIKYSKADWQEHLFTDKELKDMEGKPQNFKSHQSMLRSGALMITEFQNNILPHIKNVISMQEYVKIENHTGDIIKGYSDLVCEWDDGSKLVLDIKTSASKYADDCVLTEDKGKQTALYYQALQEKYDLDGAGFLVLEKKIRKKKEAPTRSQIIIDIPPEELILTTFEEYDRVIDGIKLGKFESHHPDCNMYYGDCICNLYYPSEGEDMTGLVHVPRKKR